MAVPGGWVTSDSPNPPPVSSPDASRSNSEPSTHVPGLSSGSPDQNRAGPGAAPAAVPVPAVSPPTSLVLLMLIIFSSRKFIR